WRGILLVEEPAFAPGVEANYQDVGGGRVAEVVLSIVGMGGEETAGGGWGAAQEAAKSGTDGVAEDEPGSVVGVVGGDQEGGAEVEGKSLEYDGFLSGQVLPQLVEELA